MHNQLAQPALFPTMRLWQAFCPTRALPLLLLHAVAPLPLPDHEPRNLTSLHMRVILALQAFLFSLLYSYCILLQHTLRGLILLCACARAQSPVPRALCLDRSLSTENHGELLWDSTGAASASGPPRCRSPVGVPRQIRSIRCCLPALFAVTTC
jgi:hypothetical protein